FIAPRRFGATGAAHRCCVARFDERTAHRLEPHLPARAKLALRLDQQDAPLLHVRPRGTTNAGSGRLSRANLGRPDTADTGGTWERSGPGPLASTQQSNPWTISTLLQQRVVRSMFGR